MNSMSFTLTASIRVNIEVFNLELTARVLVGTVGAVFFSVAEESAFNTLTITASQVSFFTKRLISDQQRLHLALFVLQLAILHSTFPVTSLLFNIEVQTGWATNGLKTLKRNGETNETVCTTF